MEIEKPISEIFSNIDTYLFKYKKGFSSQHGINEGVDDKSHIGVMAQDLQENPITENTVIENENGELEINIQQLCFTLTAVVADLAKRVGELEEIITNKGM